MPCSESALSLPQWLSLLKKRCLNQKEFKVRSSLLLRVFSWCMRLPASGFTAQYSVSQWQLFLLIFPLPLLFFKTFSVYLNWLFHLSSRSMRLELLLGRCSRLRSQPHKRQVLSEALSVFFVLPPASVSATSTKICTSMRLLSF